MVASEYIDLGKLTLDELAGIVNLYPWFGAARMELCRRMAKLGGDAWGDEQYAAQAMYICDRGALARMLRSTKTRADYSDAEVESILQSYMEADSAAAEEGREHSVKVVGGDYFSQAQYDDVRRSSDSIFARFAGKEQPKEDGGDDEADIAGRFATETLARIFAEQGLTEQAKRIYSRLILDIPEKSAYFASLIDELK